MEYPLYMRSVNLRASRNDFYQSFILKLITFVLWIKPL